MESRSPSPISEFKMDQEKLEYLSKITLPYANTFKDRCYQTLQKIPSRFKIKYNLMYWGAKVHNAITDYVKLDGNATRYPHVTEFLDALAANKSKRASYPSRKRKRSMTTTKVPEFIDCNELEDSDEDYFSEDNDDNPFHSSSLPPRLQHHNTRSDDEEVESNVSNAITKLEDKLKDSKQAHLKKAEEQWNESNKSDCELLVTLKKCKKRFGEQ